MKEALKERADDLSGVCIKEFLSEKRRKEDWDKVSLVQDQLHRLKANVFSSSFIIFVFTCKLRASCKENILSTVPFMVG